MKAKILRARQVQLHRRGDGLGEGDAGFWFRDHGSPLLRYLFTFVCADDRLLAIAQAEGLLIENPNHHP